MKSSFKKGLWVIALVLVLNNCSHRKPIDIDGDVRDPAEQADSVIQIAPLVPEAVQLLIIEAEEQRLSGYDKQAILTLKRALSISPGSALVQQHLAEMYLSDGAYREAFDWSELVVNQGPNQGPLCERARRTLALAAEMLGDVATQANALEAIAGCTQIPANRF